MRLTDREQIHQLKEWWNDYGKAIAIAIIVGLLIGYGWQWFQRYRTEHNIQASETYQTLLSAASGHQTTMVSTLGKQLMDHYSSTPYASMAAFLLAAQDVDQKQNANAVKDLSWVIAHGKVKSLRQIARLRVARVYLAMNQNQPALDVLSIVDDAAYRPMINAELGDVYKAMGQTDKARTYYATASKQLAVAHVTDPFLSFKASVP